MKNYSNTILNMLLDKYERSSLYKSDNVVNVKIDLKFTKDTMPDYFNEYKFELKEEINTHCMSLEERGYIKISWKKYQEGNIIEKVELVLKYLEDIYKALGRVKKASMEEEAIDILLPYASQMRHADADSYTNGHSKYDRNSSNDRNDENYNLKYSDKESCVSYDRPKDDGTNERSEVSENQVSCDTEDNNENWLASFATEMMGKLNAKASIKRYLDIDDPQTIKDIMKALQAISKIEAEIPKRVLSIHLFKDSKRLEALESKLTRIMIDFGGFDDETDVLAECNVVSNPGYVYMKGNGIFKCNEGEIDLEALAGEIALGTALIRSLEVKNLKVKRVLTIENLTSFHAYKAKDELVIYLGGYHNSIRRELLMKLYKFDMSNDFYHWGDIDLGGFRILNHLRCRTGIPFKSYLMDVETLRNYHDYCKSIDSKCYLEQLSELRNDERFFDFREAVDYMVGKRVRLEQEAIEINKKYY